ncbi:MAG: hypothetical protein ACRDNK_13115 [Solirubrobacteraceae bacterium]
MSAVDSAHRFEPRLHSASLPTLVLDAELRDSTAPELPDERRPAGWALASPNDPTRHD